MAIANITGNILTDSGVATSSLLPLTGGTLTGALNGTSAVFSGFLGVNGSPGTAFPFEAYINSSTAYSSTSRGNVMRVYNSNTGANVFAGIELGGAGTANDGLAGLSAVVTGSGSAALTFYTRDGGTFAERLRIASGGSVNIAMTSNDYARLAVKANSTLNYGGFNVYANGNNNFIALTHDNNVGWITTEFASGGTGFTPLAFATGGAERMRIGSAGLLTVNSLISTYTTSSGANMYVNPSTGEISRSTSSIKYKKNVENYTKGLAEVMQLRAVSYEGKSEIDAGKTFAGFIAEEIHDLGLTEFVQYAEDGSPDALSYQNMVALLTKAIQELSAKVSALENKS